MPLHNEEIEYQDPLYYFAVFAEEEGAILFDSADLSHPWSRYSYLAADPFEKIRVETSSMIQNPFQEIQQRFEKYSLPFKEGFPPWQGGLAGFFSYDSCHFLEKLPKPLSDDSNFPAVLVGFYDVVVAFDHLQKRAWILSTGFPETTKRADRASARANWMKELLKEAKPLDPLSLFPESENWECNFTQNQYETAVQRVIDYIYAGDIFQANLSRRFKKIKPSALSAFEVYRRLRSLNPAPFAGFMNGGDLTIASSSPERFLKVDESRQVETAPIKGTIKRVSDPLEDQRLQHELEQSEKDCAENIMIVDLLRNDLSKVCQPHSVLTPILLEVQSFATVHHLVSTVTGVLSSGHEALELLESAFPGGSITGAPKIRAMEIISELEPTARGPYCGSLVYVGFNGVMDSNILIRTFLIKGDVVTFQAGGGITADSDPKLEFIETTHKAAALLKALP